MRMEILLILLISINGINCINNGMSIDSLLSTYSNSIFTIWEYGTEDQDPCSGTIITLSHIVTTGACVQDADDYEFYVTVRGTDPNDIMHVDVLTIHRYHDLRRVYDDRTPNEPLWLNNIAILHLEHELPRDRNIEPMSLDYQTWNPVTSMECYTIGYNVISPTIMIPQWSTVIIPLNSCASSGISRLPHEVLAVSKTLATFTAIDSGISLICNGTATGMIVNRIGNGDVAAVLIFAFYQDFIEYIIAGGVAQIGGSAVHVVVAIFESNEFRCGGFAVHNHYVVTAAHCVYGKDIANLLVAFSHLEIPTINSASQWSSVESMEVHPLYESVYNQNLGGHSMENNIAILKLKSDLPWNPSIRLKDLPNLRHISADRPCEILRWTDQTSGDTEKKILVKSYVKIYGTNEWIQSGPPRFRVGGFYVLRTATDNDIGNPIIFDNNVIGMVIKTFQLAVGLDLVTCLKIRPYEAFIRDFINRA